MALMTIADLEQLEQRQNKLATPQITKRDGRNRLLGMMKMIVFFSGGDMRAEVDPMDFMVRRVDELEAQAEQREKDMQALIEKYEAEKATYRQSMADEISGYKKALRNIAAVLDIYSDPFGALPFSKWKNENKGKWMLAAAESIKWAVQRADNTLDPVNAVPIAPDEVS